MIILTLQLLGLVFIVYCGLRATEYLESGEVFKLSLPIKVAVDTNHPRLSMVGDFMRGSRRNRINASIDIILFMLEILVFGITLGLARFTNWPTLRVGVAFMIFIFLTSPFDVLLPIHLYHYWDKHSSESFTMIDPTRRQVAFKWQLLTEILINLWLILTINFG